MTRSADAPSGGADPTFWAGRAVCVTGGTGFLGTHLVRLLLARGARVRSFGLPGNPPPDGAESVTGEITDATAVRRAVAGCEVVFHTAGPVGGWGAAQGRMREVHVRGTENVLAAADPAARVVHTSSVAAVGAARSPVVLDESSPFTLDRLRVDYVHAKRAAEQVALAATGRDVVVVNPGYLVGPDDPGGSLMGRLCVHVWRGHVLAPPAGGTNAVDVRDVAAGHLLAAERGRAGRRYILGGENVTMREFLLALARAGGLRHRAMPRLPGAAFDAVAVVLEAVSRLTGREPVSSVQAARVYRYFWYYRSDRAAAELGYRPRPLAATLADTHEWHARHTGLEPHPLTRWWVRPGGRPHRPPAESPS